MTGQAPAPGGPAVGGPAVTGLALAALALTALGAAVPAIAIVAVWPFLFLVPGWLLVSRAAPDLSAAGRTGLAVVASVYLSGHLVNALAAATSGLRAPVVLAAAAILVALSWVLARVRLPGLAPPPMFDPGAALHAIRRCPAPWIVAGTGAAVVGVVLGLGIWHQVPGGWVSGGWNWSDFLVHVSIGKSIAAGNYPPQVPYFAGEPLTYHWFADFHGSLSALVAGADIIPVFVLSSAIMTGALALVCWELARLLSGESRVATLAAILVLFAGGMGYLRLPIDMDATRSGALDLIAVNSYDNNWFGGWPYFRIPSVLGTGLLAHRATVFGLPGLVGVVLLTASSLGRRPAGVLLAGVLAAFLAPFHFYYFPAAYLLVLLLVITRREWRSPTVVRDAVLFLAPLVLALPYAVGPVLRQAEYGSLQLVAGWELAPFADGPLAVAFFYLTNLGVPFFLAVVAAGVATIRRELPARWFLLAWAVALFLVPNVLQGSSISFDMNKYFQAMWVAVAILAAWLLVRWPRPLVAVALAASVLSPLLVATWFVIGQPIVLTTAQERAAHWIEANTPERSVFLTDDWVASPVDLAGRLRITTFGPYVENLGYDPEFRAQDVRLAYCGGDVAAAEVMALYGATYAITPSTPIDCGSDPPTEFDASPLFETAYSSGGVSIWRLRSTEPPGAP